jgi:chemotaxis regulatin CheY-phosphate phosphatase CheZ
MASDIKEMDKLGTKLDELKTLFSVGEKIIPGIQKLIDFIQEMAPLLVHINESIEESNSQIPQATDHISDVTSATELATTEILDLIDAISTNSFELSNILKEISEKEEEKRELLKELSDLIPDNEKAQELIVKISEKLSVGDQKDHISSILEKIQMDSSNIAIALQVQDITTQQLSAVNHLIISVQKRLSGLMFELESDGVKQINPESEIVVPTDKNFDMNASFINQKSSQDDIDKLINESSSASQDEIDKLFG